MTLHYIAMALACLVSIAVVYRVNTTFWKNRLQLEKTVHSTQLAEFSGKLEEITGELTRLKGESERHARLAKVHMDMNAEFEQQAKEAWDRYHAAGLMAGNAQAWLLRDLDGVLRQLNHFRQKEGLEPAGVDPRLASIVSEFKREHVSA